MHIPTKHRNPSEWKNVLVASPHDSRLRVSTAPANLIGKRSDCQDSCNCDASPCRHLRHKSNAFHLLPAACGSNAETMLSRGIQVNSFYHLPFSNGAMHQQVRTICTITAAQRSQHVRGIMFAMPGKSSCKAMFIPHKRTTCTKTMHKDRATFRKWDHVRTKNQAQMTDATSYIAYERIRASFVPRRSKCRSVSVGVHRYRHDQDELFVKPSYRIFGCHHPLNHV